MSAERHAATVRAAADHDTGVRERAGGAGGDESRNEYGGVADPVGGEGLPWRRFGARRRIVCEGQRSGADRRLQLPQTAQPRGDFSRSRAESRRCFHRRGGAALAWRRRSRHTVLQPRDASLRAKRRSVALRLHSPVSHQQHGTGDRRRSRHLVRHAVPATLSRGRCSRHGDGRVRSGRDCRIAGRRDTTRQRPEGTGKQPATALRERALSPSCGSRRAGGAWIPGDVGNRNRQHQHLPQSRGARLRKPRRLPRGVHEFHRARGEAPSNRPAGACHPIRQDCAQQRGCFHRGRDQRAHISGDVWAGDLAVHRPAVADRFLVYVRWNEDDPRLHHAQSHVVITARLVICGRNE